MSERLVSGNSPDNDTYGFTPYATGAQQALGTAFADDTTGISMSLPYVPQQYAPGYGDDTGGWATQDPYAAGAEQSWGGQSYDRTSYGHASYGYQSYENTSYDRSSYNQTSHDRPSYENTSHERPSYEQPSYGQPSYEQPAYDHTSYNQSSYQHTSYDQSSYEHTANDHSYDPNSTDDTGGYTTGSYATTGYGTGAYTGATAGQQEWDSGAYPVYGYGYAGGYGYGYDANGDTGLYEQVQVYDTGYTDVSGLAGQPAHTGRPEYDSAPHAASPAAATATFAAPAPAPADAGTGPADDAPLSSAGALAEEWDDEPAIRHDYAQDGLADGEPGSRPAARSRRRKPAKRSVLLTVAVPSVAVMGVAAVGAAAVTGVGMAQDSPHAQADGASTSAPVSAPTQQLDRQLAGVSRDADDFATRANRSQERIDLKERQDAAKKAAEAAAARKEALRPKFVLPVTQRGLSAYFGQAGEHWMTLHTGIDFPVEPGTPVMAATDGTVRTQWNPSYGNMVIVTAPDGTETWYCHLRGARIRSGFVKAGTVIAYSGNTGNTTGPHLHFEVRPHGGSPIDPLPWLLAHGLDPR